MTRSSMGGFKKKVITEEGLERWRRKQEKEAEERKSAVNVIKEEPTTIYYYKRYYVPKKKKVNIQLAPRSMIRIIENVTVTFD